MSEAPSPLATVASYYADRLDRHGATPRGVDWNGTAGQERRFDELLRIIPADADRITLGEVGCGYGALVDHVAGDPRIAHFVGIDIAPEMVAAAQARHAGNHQARFLSAARFDEPVDYCVASGIFNVRPGIAEAEWTAHVEATIADMDRAARRGFAFNALTIYSDRDRMRDYLHYADPMRLFDLCKRRYARDVAVLHDYGLYEFTVLVRKDVA